MTKAVWNNTVVAESDDTIVRDGNHYFPADAVRSDLLIANPAQTICPRKGTASYYDIMVDGHTNAGAAWSYLDPKPTAADIQGRIAFWRGVKIHTG